MGGLKEEMIKSKVVADAECGKRVMENLVPQAKCGKWVHGRCMKMKRVYTAKVFVFKGESRQ